MLRIAFDIDGVLCNFEDGVIEALKAEFSQIPDDYHPEQWAIEKDLEKRFGIPAGDVQAVYYKLMVEEDFWEDLDAYEEATEELRAFLKRNEGDAEVFFVTSRPSGTLRATNRWLEDNGILRYNSALIEVVSKKHKPAVFVAINAKYSIDDHPGVVAWADTLTNHHAYLLIRSHNEQEAATASVNKVHSVKEFLDATKKY